MNPYQVVSMDPTVVATPTATPTATLLLQVPLLQQHLQLRELLLIQLQELLLQHQLVVGQLIIQFRLVQDSGFATLPFTPGKAGDCLVFTAWSNGGTSSSPSIANS